MDYLNNEVFPVLLPALKHTLDAAKLNNCLLIQKSRFNGIDFLAELLWNRNPKHSNRETYTEIFDIPFAIKILQENPRPILPKSWLWTETTAATIIQAAVRGFLVRCRPEVQQVRQFWKLLGLYLPHLSFKTGNKEALAIEKLEKKAIEENTE